MSVLSENNPVRLHAVTPLAPGTQSVVVEYEPPRVIDVSKDPAGFHQTGVPALPQNYTIKDGHAVDFEYEPNGSRKNYEGLDYAACGSASVAAELIRNGFFATVEGVDGHMRPRLGAGGSLYGGDDYLRRRGLQADTRFGGTWEDLKNGLNAGFGVIVSFTHSSSDHTVVLTGMYQNDAGEDFVTFQDWKPDELGKPPTLYAMSKAKFLEHWNDLRLNGVKGPKIGVHNTYTLVGGADQKLPPGGSTLSYMQAQLPMTLLDAWQQLAIMPHYFAEGEVLGGTARLFSGLIEGAVQLPAAAVMGVGTLIEWALEKPCDWAVNVVKNGAWWEKLLAILLLIPMGLTYLAARFTRYVGSAIGFITSMPAHLLSYPFRKLADWARDDDDAVETLRYANPDGSRREKENYERLKATPVMPGKVDLIERMISGHISDEEKNMMVRVFNATMKDGYATDDTAALMACVGRERLDKALADHKGWAAVKAAGKAPAEKPVDKPTEPPPVVEPPPVEPPPVVPVTPPDTKKKSVRLDAVQNAGPMLRAPALV